MKLVIGGTFQGKTEYAKQTYAVEEWIDGRDCEWDEVFTAKGIHHFHEYIKRMIEAGKEVQGFADQLVLKNPNAVIVTNELGYGVVPLGAFDRRYRETTGRVCTVLAAASDQVVRVVCGIGQVIKG